MLIDHALMRRWGFLLVVALAFGCTKPNPLSCADGTCTDPAFPFCDVDGALDGTAGACIAVACEPATFESCRSDFAITCNTAGTDFDLIRCERGCEDGIGCRLCDPNETACTNGTVATCDASGAVVASEPCPLGCFESEPRCRDIKPSNNLGQFADMVEAPPDLDESNVEFTETGLVRVGIEMITVPNFFVPVSGNGVAIRVYVVNNLKLNSATLACGFGFDERRGPCAAIAIVAKGAVTIAGEVLVKPQVGTASTGCQAGKGIGFQDQDDRLVTAGGGGGGNATAGGTGGAVNNIVNPVSAAAGDPASGTAGLVPLRGGCSGGLFGSTDDWANGGAAFQLSSGGRLSIEGTIDVNGGLGGFDFTFPSTGNGVIDFVGGGGAGGSLLLEGAEIQLGPDAKLLAGGGNGRGCATTASASCGPGGVGATTDAPGMPGTGIQAPPNVQVISGAGGGGLGRIRINTPTESFVSDSAATVIGAVTTGTLETR